MNIRKWDGCVVSLNNKGITAYFWILLLYIFFSSSFLRLQLFDFCIGRVVCDFVFFFSVFTFVCFNHKIMYLCWCDCFVCERLTQNAKQLLLIVHFVSFDVLFRVHIEFQNKNGKKNICTLYIKLIKFIEIIEMNSICVV